MNPEKNPFAIVLSKLAGIKAPPLRARQGWAQMMHEDYPTVVEPVVKERWQRLVEKGLGKDDKNDAPYRALIAREIFTGLPMAKQEEYVAHAKADKAAALATYETSLKALYTTITPKTKQL